MPCTENSKTTRNNASGSDKNKVGGDQVPEPRMGQLGADKHFYARSAQPDNLPSNMTRVYSKYMFSLTAFWIQVFYVWYKIPLIPLRKQSTL